MTFDMTNYQRLSAKLEVEDIDFDTFREQPLGQEALRCLRYMHDVENHTVCYLRDVLVTRAHRDPEVTSFLTLWNYEEFWHGEAIAAILAAHDEPSGKGRIAALRQRLPEGGRLEADQLPAGIEDHASSHRGAHDLGRGQRVDHPGGLRPAGQAGRPPDAERAPPPDHEAGGPPHRLLRHPGPVEAGRQPGRPTPHPLGLEPLLGSGGQWRAPRPGGRLPEHLPVRGPRRGGHGRPHRSPGRPSPRPRGAESPAGRGAAA